MPSSGSATCSTASLFTDRGAAVADRGSRSTRRSRLATPALISTSDHNAPRFATVLIVGFTLLLLLGALSLLAVTGTHRSLSRAQTEALRMQSAAAELAALQQHVQMTARILGVQDAQLTGAELAGIAEAGARIDDLRTTLASCCSAEVDSLGEVLAAFVASEVLPAPSDMDRARRTLARAAIVDEAFLALRSEVEAEETARMVTVLAAQGRFDALALGLPVALFLVFWVGWAAFARYLFHPLRALTAALETAAAGGVYMPVELGVREFRSIAGAVGRLVALERARNQALKREAAAQEQSEQARLERILQDSSRVLAELAAPVFVLDAKGRVQLWNRSMADVTGMAVGRVFGADLLEGVLDAPSLAPLRDAYLAALIGRPSAQIEVQLPRVGGRSVLFSVVPFRSGDSVESVIFIGKEVSELRRALVEAEVASRATQHALERLDLVLEASGAVVWELGADGGALEVVGQHRWHFREDRGGLERFVDAVHEDDRSSFEPALAAVLDQGGALDLECRLRTRDGGYRWAHLIAQPSPGESTADSLVVVGSIIDVHERVVQAQRIWDMAHRDALTGLANRTEFTQRLAEAVEDRERPLLLALVDLNDFKQINDSLGHAVGDAALCALARLLEVHFPPPSWPARIGGDEFVLVLEGMTRPRAEQALDDLLEAAASLSYAPDAKPGVGLSLGVAERLGPQESPEDLLQRADEAMYRAKSEKHAGSAYRFHEAGGERHIDQVRPRAPARADVQQDEAIEAGCLVERACPGGEVVGVHLLARWRCRPLTSEREQIERLQALQDDGARMRRMLDELLCALVDAEASGMQRIGITLPWSCGVAQSGLHDQLASYRRMPCDVRFEVTSAVLRTPDGLQQARDLSSGGFRIDLISESVLDLQLAARFELPVDRAWLTIGGLSDVGRRVESIVNFSAGMRRAGMPVCARITAGALSPAALRDLGFDFVRSADASDCIAARAIVKLDRVPAWCGDNTS